MIDCVIKGTKTVEEFKRVRAETESGLEWF